MPMNLSFHDQVVLITGGSRGIGRAVVEQFSATDATLAIHYRREQAAAEALAQAAGNGSRAFQADLSRPEAVWALGEAVLKAYGRVDVLINNAGIALPASETLSREARVQLWQQTLQVNLIAAAQLCHALLPAFISQGNGRMVHIASRAAFRGDTPEYMAYAASKAGLVALSRSIARGYGKQGITSFVVAPGFTQTDMAQQFIDEYGEALVLNDLALGKLTQAEDVAPTVVFLSSGLMDHATGCTIDINAGSYVR